MHFSPTGTALPRATKRCLHPGLSHTQDWLLPKNSKPDVQVETQKDRSLRRRIQSLQCFLFEQLHRELTQPHSIPAQPPTNPPERPLLTTSEPASPLSNATPEALQAATPSASLEAAQSSANAGTTAGTAETPAAVDVATAGRSRDEGIAQQGSGGQAAQGEGAAEGSRPKTVIDSTFGMLVKQRTKVLTGVQADKFRESRSFQVHSLLQTVKVPVCFGLSCFLIPFDPDRSCCMIVVHYIGQGLLVS